MPFLDLDDCRLYYEDRGEGRPVLFLHGVWMSSEFFRHQVAHLSRRWRVVAPDFRGHGRSPAAEQGHTVPTYARDVRRLLQSLGLKEVVAVGWSMGAFVVWDYYKQFGANGLKAAVVIDQSASDYCWPDWHLGTVTFEGLRGVMTRLQTERPALLRDFARWMFKAEPAESDLLSLCGEMSRLSASAAGAIFFDQTLQDYRPMLGGFHLPTLLCFGRDEKMMPVAAGPHLLRALPDARLTVFEESGHCPFLEEPEAFNGLLEEFLSTLD